MNKITSLALFVAGIVLLIFGLNSADSVSSSVSEAVTGAPTDKSIWLIVLGIIGILSGGAGFFFGRRTP
jgi:LPXTG-motif cell wall-anchored protein